VSSKKKPAIGRNLGSLLGESTINRLKQAPQSPEPSVSVSAPPQTTVHGETLRLMPVDLLRRGKYQPRTAMNGESLQQLADSIKAQGLIQPIVIRPVASQSAQQHYEILAGERRWRAAQMAGLSAVPVVIRDVSDRAASAMSLIENIQREDLNPLEEAKALQRLADEFTLTHQDLAETIGRSRASITNLLRLLELSADVQKLLAERQIDMGHAKVILGLSKATQQLQVAKQVVRDGLSVRATESLVRRLHSEPSKKPEKPSVDVNIRKLETDISESLATRVQLKHKSSGQGELVIHYSNLDVLDGILARLKSDT
jgi:ParB family transcriptional regulator, chromosome partitioning protein